MTKLIKVVVDVTTLEMARKLVKIQRKIEQDALGKVNKTKEIRINTVNV